MNQTALLLVDIDDGDLCCARMRVVNARVALVSRALKIINGRSDIFSALHRFESKALCDSCREYFAIGVFSEKSLLIKTKGESKEKRNTEGKYSARNTSEWFLLVDDLATTCLCSGRMRRLPVSLDFYSFCKEERRQINVFLRVHTHGCLRARAFLALPIVRFIVEPRFLFFFTREQNVALHVQPLILVQLVGTIRGMASSRVGVLVERMPGNCSRWSSFSLTVDICFCVRIVLCRGIRWTSCYLNRILFRWNLRWKARQHVPVNVIVTSVSNMRNNLQCYVCI